jgi:hypothetical protein
MADEIRATPRSPILGLFSDLVNLPLQYMSAPERTQQMQGAAQFLYGTGIPKTLERASYGESLFSGAGGLGGTTRMRPETAEAVLNVAPFAKPAAVMANQAAMTAGRAGARYAERVVPQVMSRGGLPAQLLGDVSRGSIRPLDVYHGTPHTLPPTPRNPLGEFDALKIGTGEGNQAYGYGIYTAEAPAVATRYKLAEATYKTMQGNLTNKQEFVADMLSQGRPETSILDLYAQKYGGSFDDAMKDLIDVKEIYKKSGNLYKVDLPDEKIATMLDWDKPITPMGNLQIKPVAKDYDGRYGTGEYGGYAWHLGDIQIDKAFRTVEGAQKYAPYGNQVIKELNAITGTPTGHSELLQKEGIAGIKYFDEGSRSAGQGTRNFVVFPNEEKSMTILERNGMPASQIQTPTYSDPFGNTIGSSIR